MTAARYAASAPLYDVLFGEWPVYRAGRVRGIEGLGLREGEFVLDVGCGTGLNFPLLQERVGPRGHVVGIDASGQMLRQARRRCDRRSWHNVDLICADATTVDPAEVRACLPAGVADAVIATYALSLMPRWTQAWQRAVDVSRPGARLAVVDMARPVGRAAPLARLAYALGGADIDAHPWCAVERSCFEVSSQSLRGGHVQVRVGTRGRE